MQGHAQSFFLFRQLLGRELSSRYKTTSLGTIWLVLQPLLMLGVYTLVFSGIFKVRWAHDQSTTDFALVLFAGLLIFNFFSEVLVVAPGLIVGQPNYVKKVVFPVGLLPVVKVAAALVTGFISLAILLLVQLAFGGGLAWSMLLSPLVLVAMVPMMLGIAWALSALGVYLRDISQFVGIVASMMLFLSPIFFPSSSIPPKLSFLVTLNPLVFPIEQLRAMTVQPGDVDWFGLLVYILISIIFAWICLAIFKRLSRGFADVI
jgi:lipopolysaccharide transport system permease protein